MSDHGRLTRAVLAVHNVLRPHLGADVSLERARNLTLVWAWGCDEEPFTEAHAAEQIRAARLPCYGAVHVSDDEVSSLAARCVLALECVE